MIRIPSRALGQVSCPPGYLPSGGEPVSCLSPEGSRLRVEFHPDFPGCYRCASKRNVWPFIGVGILGVGLLVYAIMKKRREVG